MIKGTFLGRKMSQSINAINLWEQTIAREKFSRLIEIGTFNGNFSHYLSLLCLEKKADFDTYDILDYKNDKISLHFHRLDVFAIEDDLGRQISSPGKSIVFCDGGDKPRELKTFSKYLKPDDLIIVHDWGEEICHEDIPGDLVKVFAKECFDEGHTRIFKKICLISASIASQEMVNLSHRLSAR